MTPIPNQSQQLVKRGVTTGVVASLLTPRDMLTVFNPEKQAYDQGFTIHVWGGYI